MTRQVPAVEGLLQLGDAPTITGRRCSDCGTVAFPFAPVACPNPECAGRDFEAVALPRTGTVWSFTDARYQPPPPFISGDPFAPFAIAAVELDGAGLVVLGQVAGGFSIGDLHVGAQVEVVAEPLYRDAEGTEHMVWRWKPVGAVPTSEPPPVPVHEVAS